MEEDADLRCDVVVRSLQNFQRDCWLDIRVTDTGSRSNTGKGKGAAVEEAEQGKIRKHGDRVGIAEGADFRPLVASVYGTLGPYGHTTLYQCAERRCGREAAKSTEFGRTLHLLRARVQGGILDAASLCLLNRKGKNRDADGEATLKMRLSAEDVEEMVPWECVLADCAPRGGHQ